MSRGMNYQGISVICQGDTTIHFGEICTGSCSHIISDFT